MRSDFGTNCGIIFQFRPCYPLTASNITWVGEAAGQLELAETAYWGVILSTPSALRPAWLPGIQGLSFENPFDVESGDKPISPELAELISMLSQGCRQATHHDLLKLKTARSLRWLNLARADIGDESLPALDMLGHLQSLELSSTRISDSGLKILSTHAGLQELILDCTGITDSGVELVATKFPKLQRLSLRDTAVSSACLTNLKQELPHCHVIA